MTQRRSPSSISARIGTVTLVAGVATAIDAGCLTRPDRCTILLSRNTPGGTLGFLAAPIADRGTTSTTFSVGSSSATDTSTVNWMAIPFNPLIAQLSDSIPANMASLRRPPSGFVIASGTTTLVAGTKTVTGIPMSPNARVFVCANTFGGTSGKLSVPDATVLPASGSFVINSNNAADTSTVNWVVVGSILRFSPSGPVFSQCKGVLAAGVSGGCAAMEPMGPLVSLASFINTSTPGNLAVPDADRNGGSILVRSSNASDASTFELASF